MFTHKITTLEFYINHERLTGCSFSSPVSLSQVFWNLAAPFPELEGEKEKVEEGGGGGREPEIELVTRSSCHKQRTRAPRTLFWGEDLCGFQGCF